MPSSYGMMPEMRSFFVQMGCIVLGLGCPAQSPERDGPGTPTPMTAVETKREHPAFTAFSDARTRMVRTQMRARDIDDPRVLAAMTRVPRHFFVGESWINEAYGDRPLPIGQRQTISQPYIVALMTQLAQVKAKSRVLDVGTGSGYQMAVLAELSGHVYGIEILCDFADLARNRLKALGYKNYTLKCGDGFAGWAAHAPYDAIIVAAAPQRIPPALIEQLAPGGRLVIPVGGRRQELKVVEKRADGSFFARNVAPVRFVPMTGRALQVE